MILESVVDGQKPAAVRVTIGDDGNFAYRMEHVVAAPADASVSPSSAVPAA